MRTRTRTIIGAVLVPLALAACGGGNTAAPTTAPVADVATSAPAPTVEAVPTSAPEPTSAPVAEPTAEAVAPTSAAAEPTSGTASASGTITKTLDNGLVQYEQASEGFAIALPATWQQLDTDPAAMKESLSQLAEKNPGFGELLSGQAQSLVAGGVKFLGLDLNSDALASGYAPNVNVITQQLPVDVTAEVALQETAKQLATVPNISQPIQQQVVKLPAGDAGEMRYTLKLQTADGKQAEAAVLQYLIIKQKTLYIVSLGTPTSDQAKYQDVFKQVADSFVLLGS